MITPDQIRQQSINALTQWRETWQKNAKIHSKYAMKPLTDFENIGVGRAVLCVANGYSTELEIETIKEHAHKVDILVCDKAMGHLLRHGIKPTYVMVCDAKVSADKYLAPWKDQLQDTIMFGNVCANPDWAEMGNWKDRYFFANMDILKSEGEFMELSGCENKIPAGTNVSNALVVFLTQSDNRGRRNFFGYDKIPVIGFDYCWRPDGNYYAFDRDGGGKHHYMRHIYCRNMNNDLCFTSNNLAFSAQWLEQYVKAFKLPVIQCSRESVAPFKYQGKLAEQMNYSFRPSDAALATKLMKFRADLLKKTQEVEQALTQLGSDHYYSFIASL